MKMNYTILCLLLLLTTCLGCTAESGMDINQPPINSQPKAQVLFNLAVPAQEIPTATRAMLNDGMVETFTIWAFNGKGDESTFIQQIDTKDAIIRTVNKQMQLFVLLPESNTPITLTMIANVAQGNTPSITAGTSKAAALQQLTYSIEQGQPTTMPMYGEVELNQIKQGMSPSAISLRRAMAQIKVDISGAYGQFVLEEATLLNINKKGYVSPMKTVIKSSFNYTEKVMATSSEENQFTCYVPEALDINGTSRISILLKGTYKKDNSTTYYRLDFINGETKINTIARNNKYLFNLTNIKDTGFSTENDAINTTKPSNAGNGSVAGDWLVITDEAIMDITSDGLYYLGVTSGKLIAGSNDEYYFANFSVVTNNTEQGWKIISDELPIGVTINKLEYTPLPANIAKAVSIWVYIDKTTYQGNKKLELFIYSANIRKKIEIELPI